MSAAADHKRAKDIFLGEMERQAAINRSPRVEKTRLAVATVASREYLEAYCRVQLRALELKEARTLEVSARERFEVEKDRYDKAVCQAHRARNALKQAERDCTRILDAFKEAV